MATKRCEYCGAVIDENDMTCPVCGGTLATPLSQPDFHTNNQGYIEYEERPKTRKNTNNQGFIEYEEKTEATHNTSNQGFLEYNNKPETIDPNDKPSIPLCILSALCCSPVFLIIGAVNYNDSPNKYKWLIISSIIGIILSLFVSPILFVLLLTGISAHSA